MGQQLTKKDIKKIEEEIEYRKLERLKSYQKNQKKMKWD